MLAEIVTPDRPKTLPVLVATVPKVRSISATTESSSCSWGQYTFHLQQQSTNHQISAQLPTRPSCSDCSDADRQLTKTVCDRVKLPVCSKQAGLWGAHLRHGEVGEDDTSSRFGHDLQAIVQDMAEHMAHGVVTAKEASSTTECQAAAQSFTGFCSPSSLSAADRMIAKADAVLAA